MHTLLPDEKTSLVMVYTHEGLVRGELVTKSAVRVSTFLRTEGAAEYLHLLKAQVISLGAGARSLQLPELYYPAGKVIAFHLAPPLEDPLDFDVTEKNRIMQSITLLVGSFQFSGKLRVSGASDFGTSIAAARIGWMSLYEVSIANPLLPQMGALQTNMAIFRPNQVAFALPG